MASEKTSNIGLNKWVPSDYVKVNEFNDNFDKIDDVAADHAAQLATKAEKSTVEQLSQTIDTIGRRLDAEHADVTTQLATKADSDYVTTLINSIAGGGVRDVYYSFSALQSAYPSGTDGIFIVLDIEPEYAHIFGWSSTESAWVDLGKYQPDNIAKGSVTTDKYADKSVTPIKIAGHGTLNIFDPSNVTPNMGISGWDTENKKPSYAAVPSDQGIFATPKMILPDSGYLLINFYLQPPVGANQLLMVADENDNYVVNVNDFTSKTWFTRSGNTIKVDISALKASYPSAFYFYTIMCYQEGNPVTPPLDKQYIYVSETDTLPSSFIPYNKASIGWLTVEYDNLNETLQNKMDTIDSINTELSSMANVVETTKTDVELLKDEVNNLSPTKLSLNDFKILNDSFSALGDWNTQGTGTHSIVSSGLNLLTNRQLLYPKIYDFNFFAVKVFITVNDITSKCAVGLFNTTYFSAMWGMCYVDFSNKKIGFLSSSNDYANIPTASDDVSFTFDVKTGKRFMLEMIREGHNLIFRLHDLFTGDYVEKTTLYKSHGAPGFNLFSGDITINKYEYIINTSKEPFLLMVGDSITEAVAASTTDKSYAVKLLKYFNNDGTIAAKAGCNSAYILGTVLPNIYEKGIRPKYVHVLIGTNDSADIETWKANIVAIYDLIASYGGVPIICVPPFGTASNEVVPFGMRDFIESKGWLTVRYDIATSIDKLGETKDTSLFGTTDQLHPIDSGNDAMFNQGVKQLKYIVSYPLDTEVK